LVDDEMVLVEVHCVRFDILKQSSGCPFQGQGEDRYLPIWIGMFEATQIEIALERRAGAAPMSHDLMKIYPRKPVT